jgi:uncharacterized caspase-like protein
MSIVMSCTRALALIAVQALVVALAHAGEAPSKVALIIANADYANPSDRLPGAMRDANLIREALENKRLGFRVISIRNATRTKMEAGLKEFMSALKEAGPAGVGFVYYVGHGGADPSGKNFLLPVDVPDVASAAVGSVGLGVREISEKLSYLDRRAAIVVVVDACRSPDASAKASSQFAPPDEQEPGFLLALSTSKGHPASDNSPYARLLAAKLLTDGLTIDQVFERVLQEVAKETNKRQIPVHQSRITEAVCLISCSAGSAASASGPYTQNPELLKSTKRDAEGWMARLASASAETRCAGGWRDLAELKASAGKAMEAGQPDAAGATYKRMIERSEQVMQYINTTNMIDQSEKSMNDLQQRNTQRWMDTRREWYEKFEKRLMAAKENAQKTEQSMGKRVDLSKAQSLEAEARSLAKAEQYDDATDKMIDALNETNAQRDKVSNHGSRPVEHPRRRAPPGHTPFDAAGKRAQMASVCS